MEKRIKVTEPEHIWRVAITAGIGVTLDKLEEQPEAIQALPGFQLAKAMVEALVHESRVEVISTNLHAVYAAGIDARAANSVRFEPDSGELVCEMREGDD